MINTCQLTIRCKQLLLLEVANERVILAKKMWFLYYKPELQHIWIQYIFSADAAGQISCHKWQNLYRLEPEYKQNIHWKVINIQHSLTISLW